MPDSTFRNYGAQQAASYAAHRGSYSSDIYDNLISYHEGQGGNLGTALDVGCGTGQATRNLARYFTRAIGFDPGQAMIDHANQLGGNTKDGEKIHFEVCAAEELYKSGLVEPASVDLLCAAMAAHWFDMEEFWPQAERVVKPGGTVALWTKSSLYCHPSTPNAQVVQKALNHLEDDVLGPYELSENRVSRGMYMDLKMPWSVVPPVATFPEAFFQRREWNRDGKLEPGSQSLDTASMVTRWRADHAELVGTDADCVAQTMKAVIAAMDLHALKLDDVNINVGSATTLLLFTKKR
ncbi:hypothetical protein G7054_g11822 [Neopestalotiopsis clavispora]|nr:hypothetical protein G7054_g11822 [Neopestalotiopsis clavispora]